MSQPHQYNDLNARGRMLETRRQTRSAEVWRLVRVSPHIGFFSRIRERFSATRTLGDRR